MADVDEPQFSTLAERIAALNKQKNFSSSGPEPAPPVQPARPAARRPPPPPPAPTTKPAPPPVPRGGPVRTESVSSSARPLGPPPKLPPRRPSNQQLQRTATALAGDRRDSSDSARSSMSTTTTTTTATLSRASTATSASDVPRLRNLPPAFGTTKLPSLPPPSSSSRVEREAREQEETAVERAPALPARPGTLRRSSDNNGAAPALPPRLPPRPRPSAANPSHHEEGEDEEPPRPQRPRRRSTAAPNAVIKGFGSSVKQLQAPQRPHQIVMIDRSGDNDDDEEEEEEERPPPLPLSSRPSRAQIDEALRGAAKGATNDASARPKLPTRPRPSANGGGSTGFYPKKSDDDECLICRDFSEPDRVAAQFPVSSLPRQNTVDYLAQNLCGPFPSPTDKARAIFTWCHHNIAYDVQGFFGGCIPRGQTMAEVIFSGKAVCEGYARVYEAIARAAGLECVVIGGHGKGYGFRAVRPGDPVPAPNAAGHAWNAVRIDGGEWKLLDACWGAGTVSNEGGTARYDKNFNPRMFTMDNETFGERHFPANPDHFFRADGRRLSWAEYIVDTAEGVDPITLYSNSPEQYIAQESITPRASEICVSRGDPDERIAFRFGRACRHWTPAAPGHDLPPYPMFLQSVSPPSSDDKNPGEMFDVAFDYDEPLWFWADVPRRGLGRAGSTLHCFVMTTMDGRDMRGRTMADVRQRLGRSSYTKQPICSWKLV